MNNEQNKNVASRGPLIFSVPASHFPFLVALNVGWLDVTEPRAEEKRRAHKATGRSNELSIYVTPESERTQPISGAE